MRMKGLDASIGVGEGRSSRGGKGMREGGARGWGAWSASARAGKERSEMRGQGGRAEAEPWGLGASDAGSRARGERSEPRG